MKPFDTSAAGEQSDAIHVAVTAASARPLRSCVITAVTVAVAVAVADAGDADRHCAPMHAFRNLLARAHSVRLEHDSSRVVLH